MKKIDWNAVEEIKEFARLCEGGYVAKIIRVEDVPDKEYLLVYCDIAEGEFKDYGYNSEMANNNDWNYIKLYRSYKQTAQGFFKSFLSTLEKSNPRRFAVSTFDGNEHKLVGLQLGIVLGTEEYQGKDGDIKLRTYAKTLTTPDAIRKGDFKVPELKKLPGNVSETPANNAAVSDDCPF